MAKQIVNPLEQHVEKALLAIAGTALIAVVVMYVTASPNQVDIDSQMVSPTEIDAKLSRKAADVRQRIRSHKPKVKSFEPLAEQFAMSLKVFQVANLSEELRAGPSIGPEVPFVDPKGAKPGQAQLVKVLTLGRPLVTHGRSTYILQGGSVYAPANWVTVAALFNREEQSKTQALEYGSQRKEIIYGPPQIQRRALHPDGTWSDGDWKIVTPWRAAKTPSLPKVLFKEENGRQIVPSENRKAIERFQEEVSFSSLQMELLRPLMPDFFNGAQWTFPPVVPCLDLLRMDDDFFHPKDVEPTPESALQDRTGLCAFEAVIEENEELTPRKQIENSFEEADKLVASAERSSSENIATLAYNIYVGISLDKNATAAQKSKAKLKYKKVGQLIKDIQRRRRHGGDVGVKGGGVGKAEERRLQPRQLIWVHDAAPGHVESGKTYEYRIRATLFNRLAGEPAKFGSADYAKVIFIPGEWSKRSDPVVVPPTSEFYVTGVDARKKTVKVEFYQWFDGHWVTTKESFKLGDTVAVKDRVELPDPDDPEEVDRPQVDFETGFTVLRIDSDRLLREKKGRGSGVRFQDSMSEGGAVLLVSRTGEVVERFVTTDKANPDKKTASGRVWRPIRKR